MGSSQTLEAAAPVATSIEGRALAQAVAELGVSHVICVPDTNLRTAISALAAPGMPPILSVCTEDEAMGINAGLYIAGQRPMLLIQNNGLYAVLNTLKAIALDARIPTLMLIGQYGRDVTRRVEDNRPRAVRLLEPTLSTWGVPYYRLESPRDLPNLRAAWERAHADRGPAAALVGAPTS